MNSLLSEASQDVPRCPRCLLILVRRRGGFERFAPRGFPRNHRRVPRCTRCPLVLVRRRSGFELFAPTGLPRCHRRVPKRPRCPAILVRRRGNFELFALLFSKRLSKVPSESCLGLFGLDLGELRFPRLGLVSLCFASFAVVGLLSLSSSWIELGPEAQTQPESSEPCDVVTPWGTSLPETLEFHRDRQDSRDPFA